MHRLGTNQSMGRRTQRKLKLKVNVLHYTLNVWSQAKGKSYFCFPKNPDVSQDAVEGNIRTRGKTKLTSFPRYHTLSALLYI